MSALRRTSPLSEDVESAALAQPSVRALPATDPNQFFHFDLLRSLQLHRRLAIGIFAAFVLMAVAYTVRGWNNYTAQALVYIQPAPPRLMDNGPTNRWPYDANTYESYIQQQMHDVTRPDVLVDALHKLPNGSWQQRGESDQSAADRLGRAIEVTRISTGYQVAITARASTAASAALLANAVAASFIDSSTRELRSGDIQRIELLREERDRVLKELSSDRAEQGDLNKELGVATISTATPDPYDEQITAIRGELVKARTASDQAAARLTAVASTGAASASALNAEADDLIAADPSLIGMKTSLSARRALLISQMANVTPSHPQYKQDADELAQINASLETMMKDLRAKASAHIQQRLHNDLQETSAVESRLNAQLAHLTSAAGGATPRLQRSNDLATDIQRLQNRYAVVDDQFRNLTMENNAPGAVYLSAAAVAPLHSATSRLFRSAIVLIIAGLLLALAVPVALNHFDSHIYIATDVERVLGFGPLAQLPDFLEVSDGAAEEYMLRLAAGIEHAYQEGSLKSCIFTGVAPGAGVTTVATRVRTMLDAMGRATVLVDASGTPAPVHESDTGSSSNTDLVTTQRGSRSSALLQAMAEETGEETIVLTDTAPLLVSGETEYLARFVDSAIIVIQSGVTTRAQLREVAHTLQRLEVTAVGFVLNGIGLAKANPAFQQSVRAVEEHLVAQGRARGTVRSTPVAPSHPDPQPVPVAAAPSTAPASAANPAIPEPVFVAVAAEQAPAQSPADVVVPHPTAYPIPPFTPTVDPPQSDPPVPQQASADPQPVVHSTARVVTVDPILTPRPLRGRGPVKFDPPSPVQPIAPPPAPRPPSAAPAASVQPNRPVTPPTTAAPIQQPDHDIQPSAPFPRLDPKDLPYSAASRLGGLRNLLVSLGIKTLDREADNRAYDDEPEPRYERQVERQPDRPVDRRQVTERPVYAASAPEPDSVAVAAPSPHSVTVQPEFLPPRVIEPLDHEKEPARSLKPKRLDYREASDDIETLPSWRGQYRKKP
jgi:Mrp family chromosome partitioning ATPase